MANRKHPNNYRFDKGHDPVCKWNETTPDGKTWKKMGGSDVTERKINFSLYRRGLYP